MLRMILMGVLFCLDVNKCIQGIKAEMMKEGNCEAGDGTGTCNNIIEQQQQEEEELVPVDRQFKVYFENKSKYRADVYWDDGRFGVMISTLEAHSEGGLSTINTFRGHGFFVTRHGVKEGLFDPSTDKQHKFFPRKPNEKFVIPENAAPSPNPCQDRFSTCAHLNCWDSPGWMIVHCCKSCDKAMDAGRLLDPKIRCSNEHLNITEPVWVPGDLNKLFTSWATQDEFTKYDPKVLSSPMAEHGGKSGPWVITFDDFLDDEEVAALIHGAELVGFERSTNQGAVNELGEMEQVVSTTRTSSNAWCTGQCENLPKVKSITDKIERVTGVPKKNYESFQILQYGHDQFYRRHHDSTGTDTTPPGNRIMTFFLYLSDVEEGGETFFNQLGIAVKPKKGRALVWPSVQNERPDFWDHRMYHEAKDVIKGTKYAANHWIHLNDYVGPNTWGCTGSFA